MARTKQTKRGNKDATKQASVKQEASSKEVRGAVPPAVRKQKKELKKPKADAKQSQDAKPHKKSKKPRSSARRDKRYKYLSAPFDFNSLVTKLLQPHIPGLTAVQYVSNSKIYGQIGQEVKELAFEGNGVKGQVEPGTEAGYNAIIHIASRKMLHRYVSNGLKEMFKYQYLKANCAPDSVSLGFRIPEDYDKALAMGTLKLDDIELTLQPCETKGSSK